MALTRSLTAGTSALRANQQRFDVISNNIANSSTTGFKSSRVNFAEQLKQTYSLGKPPEMTASTGSGGINPLQMGLGVKVASITNNMGQGNIEQTGRPLDMAIQGEGYFVYNMNGRDYYSRAGAVTRDRLGNLVDSSTGAYLQGYNALTDAAGRNVKTAEGTNALNSKLDNLRISSSVVSPPRQTENVTVSGNLNSGAEEGATRQTSITVYDQKGGTHTLTLTFTKTANPNEFSLAGNVDGNAVEFDTSDPITFNSDGTLNTPLGLVLDTEALNTALGATDLFNTATDINIKLADGDNLLAGLTQYSGPNTATTTEQDGYTQGELSDLTVDTNGYIYGSFSNGKTEVLGQVALAKFTNPAGLKKESGNYFSESLNSGLGIIGTAGSSFPSTSIAPESLEASNVDLTEQFTDMIATQRSYEAAARTITVSDQMLSETNMLKR